MLVDARHLLTVVHTHTIKTYNNRKLNERKMNGKIKENVNDHDHNVTRV